MNELNKLQDYIKQTEKALGKDAELRLYSNGSLVLVYENKCLGIYMDYAIGRNYEDFCKNVESKLAEDLKKDKIKELKERFQNLIENLQDMSDEQLDNIESETRWI